MIQMQPPPGNLRAVLFDFGDTLARLTGAGGDLVVRAAERLGGRPEPAAAEQVWETVLARQSTPEELAKGRDLSVERHREVWTRLYRDTGADRLMTGLSDAIYDLTVDPSSWELFPDALPVLETLARRGVPVGIVSDCGFDLRPTLDKLGVSRLVGTAVISGELGVCKPSPQVFRMACRLLGVDPRDALMVGDNPITDGGAADVGLTVLLLPRHQSSGPRGLGRVLSLLPAASERSPRA